MSKYQFTNIIGTFIFNEHYRVIDKLMFSNKSEYKNKDKFEKDLLKKHKDAIVPEGKAMIKIMEHFKDKQYHSAFYRQNIEFTKELVKNSVIGDTLIIQTISSIEDINKVINTLTKRLREWYGYYNPEFKVENPIAFVEIILKKSKQELLREGKVQETMGADFSKQDLAPIMELGRKLIDIYELRESEERYLEGIMNKVCPNVTAITGATIGAKLLNQAGSLKDLMEFPSSTIQVLGAEKAFFRHLKTGAKSPKFGFIHEHSLINKAKTSEKGRVARSLADKIAIACKVDYFKGKFIGDQLRNGLEAKFR